MSAAAPFIMGGLQIFSAISGYSAEKKAAKETQRANEAAAAAAAEEARLTREDAAYRAQKEREDAAKVRSQQIALYLKSGVTLDGSPMLVADSTTSKGQENAQNILTNADSRARSITKSAEANRKPVTKENFFGAASNALSGNPAIAKLTSK